MVKRSTENLCTDPVTELLSLRACAISEEQDHPLSMIGSCTRSYPPDGIEAMLPIMNPSTQHAVRKICQLGILGKHHSNFRNLVPIRYIGSCTECGA
jgi:hypothetical protein